MSCSGSSKSGNKNVPTRNIAFFMLRFVHPVTTLRNTGCSNPLIGHHNVHCGLITLYVERRVKILNFIAILTSNKILQ